jgi:hypothetical protein
VLFLGATAVPYSSEAVPDLGSVVRLVRQCHTLQTITTSF